MVKMSCGSWIQETGPAYLISLLYIGYYNFIYYNFTMCHCTVLLGMKMCIFGSNSSDYSHHLLNCNDCKCQGHKLIALCDCKFGECYLWRMQCVIVSNSIPAVFVHLPSKVIRL